MNRENNSAKNDRNGSIDRNSTQISEEKHKLNDSNIAKDSQNAKNTETSKKISIAQQKPLKKLEMSKRGAKRKYMKEWRI